LRFTFIMEVDGGTYVSQVDAADEVEATLAWCEKFPAEKIKGLRKKTLAESVRKELKEYGLAPLDGLDGVWCASPRYKKRLALMNVVRCG